MSITVGDIYGAFPGFRPEDMIKLCNGNKNLNGRTEVPLSNIASFGNQDLSIFAAKEEGKTFTNLVSKGQRTQLNQAAGIVDKSQDKDKNPAGQNVQQAIPMDTSIFNLSQKKKQAV